MKATRKGKKQETVHSDLAHILGYTGMDMDPLGPPSPVGSEKETAAAGLYAVHDVCMLFISILWHESQQLYASAGHRVDLRLTAAKIVVKMAVLLL